MSRRTLALVALLVSSALPSPAWAQTRAVLVVQWNDPSAAEVAAAARGALAGTGAEVVPEAETSAALAFLGNPATLDDEGAERLRGALSAQVLYVIAVLPASEASLNVAVRTFDGGAPRSAFGRSTREELAGYVVGQLLSASSAPPNALPAPPTTRSAVPAEPAIAAVAAVAPEGALFVGQEVAGNTAATGTDTRTPTCGSTPGSPDQTWSFTAPSAGIHRFRAEATFDSTIAIYAPNGQQLACNRHAGRERASEVAATLVAGRTYQIVVDGFRGATGSYTLQVLEGAPDNANRVGAAILFGLLLVVSPAFDLLAYFGSCGESPLCRDHPAISWIPVIGPLIALALPQVDDSALVYGLAAGAEGLLLTVAILIGISGPGDPPEDTTPDPLALRFDVAPTDGGALAVLRGEWR